MVPINYLAVLVCAVVSMVIGFLWFGPLFGKKWMTLSGMNPDMMKNPTPEMKRNMYRGYAIQFVLALVMAFGLAHTLVFASSYLHMSGISAGLQGGFWSWLSFVVPTTIGMVLWEGKPWKLWIIIVSAWLVTLLVMGSILAVWM